METIAATFSRLAAAVAAASRVAYPLAELNDLLTDIPEEEIGSLPQPLIPQTSFEDAYRLNYVTAMVELAANRRGVMPPAWTSDVKPLATPVFIDPSLALRPHLLTASPPPFRRRNIFIDSSLGDRV
jgi:hypothetical protein